MNLLTDACWPFRTQDNQINWRTFSSILDDDVVDFAFNRGDFQGAAYEFGCSVLQTCFAPEDSQEWYDSLMDKPEKKCLDEALLKIAPAFNVDGDGDAPRFMQTKGLTGDPKKLVPIRRLLIDGPGDNTEKLNKDFFFKSTSVPNLSPMMAAMALYTFQIYSGQGGSGHRLGVRGRGPLTTLVRSHNENARLWEQLWLNVINRDEWIYDDPEEDFNNGRIFAWQLPSETLTISPEQKHPLYVLWAMSRKVELDFKDESGLCAVSREQTKVSVSHFAQEAKGNTYGSNWNHPYSPYVTTKLGNRIPRPAGWMEQRPIRWEQLSLKPENPQSAVRHFQLMSIEHELIDMANILAFGYDMSNAKALCWHFEEMPLLAVDPENASVFYDEINELQEIRSKGLWYLEKALANTYVKMDKVTLSATIQRTVRERFSMLSDRSIKQAIEWVLKKDPESVFLTEDQSRKFVKSMKIAMETVFDDFAQQAMKARDLAPVVENRISMAKRFYKDKAINNFIKDRQQDSEE